MGKIVLTRPVNLAQLDAELGQPGCTLRGDELEVEGVTDVALEAAVSAHTLNPEYGAPAEETRVRQASVKAQAVLAGTDTFTASEVQRALAALILRATR